MRAVTSCCITLLLIGCGKPADKPEDTTVGEAPAMEEKSPAGISLADMAGTWNVRSTLDGSDKVITYDLVATPDQSGWTLNFPGREPIPARVRRGRGRQHRVGGRPVRERDPEGRAGQELAGRGPACRTASWSVRRPLLMKGKVTDSVATLTLEGTRAP